MAFLVRDAHELEDAPSILALCEASLEQRLFEAPSLPALFARSTSTAALTHAEGGGLAGFAALEGVGAATAEALQEVLEGCTVTPGNTVALTCFVLSPLLDAAGAARALLYRALAALPDVAHLLLVAPAAAGIADESAALVGSPLALLGLTRAPLLMGEGTRALYLLPRPAAPLTARDARVEDTDHVAPIFEAQSEVVKEAFGEFYLAEVRFCARSQQPLED